jgi:hypothetical protein
VINHCITGGDATTTALIITSNLLINFTIYDLSYMNMSMIIKAIEVIQSVFQTHNSTIQNMFCDRNIWLEVTNIIDWIRATILNVLYPATNCLLAESLETILVKTFYVFLLLEHFILFTLTNAIL